MSTKVTKIIEKFNALNGKTVTREYLDKLRIESFDHHVWNVNERVNKVLKKFTEAKEFTLTIDKPISISKLAAPRHKGLAKEALDECGRLKKGYKYVKGGKVEKIKSKTKSKSAPKKAEEPKSSKVVKLETQTFEKTTFAPEEWKDADTRKSTSLLKKYLKEKYGIKTRVRSEFYSGGSSLNVRYDLGTDDDVVEAELKRLQYGKFDGMFDIYENNDEAFNGIILDGYRLEDYKYVFVDQKLPEALRIRMATAISDLANYNHIHPMDGTKETFSKRFDHAFSGYWSWSQWLYKLIQGNCNFATQDENKIENLKAHHSESGFESYYFTYKVDGKTYDSRKPIVNNTSMVKEKNIVKNHIKLQDYGKDYIAVTGYVGEIEDQLKEIGGKKSNEISINKETHKGYVFPKRLTDEVTNVLIDYSDNSKLAAPKKKGLAGNYEVTNNPKVDDVLDWADKNLVGKHVYHKDIDKKIRFSKSGIKKAIYGKRGVSKIRLQMVYIAKDVLQSSRLVTIQQDKKKRNHVKRIYKFVAFHEINSVPYRMFIVVRESDNGSLYYDHEAVKIKKHIQQTGGDNDLSKSTPLGTPNVLSKNKVTKKSDKQIVKSLGTLVINDNQQPAPQETAVVKEGYTTAAVVAEPKPEPIEPTDVQQIATVEQQKTTTKVVSNVNSEYVSGLRSAREASKNNTYFDLKGDFAAFLGRIEKKRKHSVVITLDAPPGAGKTRSVFQFINMAANIGLTSVFVSLEEHPVSNLFIDKADQYIEPQNEALINVVADVPPTYDQFLKIIKNFDVIAVDSWNKIYETYTGIDFDNDLRKALDGKIIVTIFQRTTNGTMRGGAKAAFDGDIILEVVKDEDFRKSYLRARKNRYQNKPLHEIGYNFYDQKLINPIEEEQANQLPTTMEI